MEDFPNYFIFTVISLAIPVGVILNFFLFPNLNPQSSESFILDLPCLFIMKLCQIFAFICILLSSKRIADKLLFALVDV